MYVIEKGGLCEEIGDMPTFDPVFVIGEGAKLRGKALHRDPDY